MLVFFTSRELSNVISVIGQRFHKDGFEVILVIPPSVYYGCLTVNFNSTSVLNVKH